MIGNRAYARKFDAIGQKSCKVCRNPFTPRNTLQRACGATCAIKLAVGSRIKKAEQTRRARRRADREALMTRGDWLKRAQVSFNRWIRLRDAGKPCISCGALSCSQWQAGHYRTTKAAPELRFDESNVHLQCSQCNLWDSGNIVEYRINLVKRIGAERVEWLEGPHEPKRYTVEQIRDIERHYKALARELVRAQAMAGNYGGTG